MNINNFYKEYILDKELFNKSKRLTNKNYYKNLMFLVLVDVEIIDLLKLNIKT